MKPRYESFSDNEQAEIEYKARIVFIDFKTEGYEDLKHSNGQDPACNSTSEISIEQVAWQSYNVSSQDLHGNYFTIEENDRNWKRLEKWCPEFIKAINDRVY